MSSVKRHLTSHASCHRVYESSSQASTCYYRTIVHPRRDVLEAGDDDCANLRARCLNGRDQAGDDDDLV
jgi:hypothetical protein